MARDIQILHQDSFELIQTFERERLKKIISDPMEAEMRSWNAPWREESLRHYLGTGWSVGLWDGSQLVGYFLAQPLLFYRGLTQVLWVEHVAFSMESDRDILIDTATRYAREKHLQSVFILQENGETKEIKTTKR